MKLLIILTIYEIFISGMYKGHEADSPAELESQFILRLPEEPSRVLREAIRNNSTLKDRLTIKIENDMRHGEVRVDHWLLPAKVMDLPNIIDSLKSIDYKGFYKTDAKKKMIRKILLKNLKERIQIKLKRSI
jgi:TATA-binding protein-associated factor Taf7